jgi:hypothetical protein
MPQLSPAFDIITVPDFSGESSACFVTRTLYFLAALEAYGGNANKNPVHLVCIGEPPPLIASVAERLNVRVHIKQPLNSQVGALANKLRGLEIQGETENFLLLDTDVLPMGDFSGLVHTPDAYHLFPTYIPLIDAEDWQQIYSLIPGNELPPKIKSTRARLGLGATKEFLARDLLNMYPYYNSGVVAGPWQQNIKTEWLKNTEMIFNHFKSTHKKRLTRCDQAGLAVALHASGSHAALPSDTPTGTTPYTTTSLSLNDHIPSVFLHLWPTPFDSFNLLHCFGLAKEGFDKDRTLQLPNLFTKRVLKNCLQQQWQTETFHPTQSVLRHIQLIKNIRKLRSRLTWLRDHYVSKWL